MRTVAYICFGAAGLTFARRGMGALSDFEFNPSETVFFAVQVAFFIGVGFLALRYAEKKDGERLDAEFRELDSKKRPNE